MYILHINIYNIYFPTYNIYILYLNNIYHEKYCKTMTDIPKILALTLSRLQSRYGDKPVKPVKFQSSSSPKLDCSSTRCRGDRSVPPVTYLVTNSCLYLPLSVGRLGVAFIGVLFQAAQIHSGTSGVTLSMHNTQDKYIPPQLNEGRT